ncbi:pseudaminic acid biosynthesis-associated methylase [Thalassospira alkalitolerans]|uniref:pseudaminic acid biosynthesis-associated methylase n=1 Tax=Thalassospira alkalitolerans TaxID=1293890 RepID=UPI0030EC3403|tara:strand:- start:52886 stop:53527 length:642 start_codon:yes stop_codon:yes gene_type:complete
MDTDQIKIWTGDFGENYTERCKFEGVEEFNALYINRYGISRDQIIGDWLKDVPKDARILEVGTNIGNQLAALQRAGFKNLYGIDVQRSAVEKSKDLYSGLDIVVGSALDIPFKDGFFDVVFTNNVLIHIAPKDIDKVLSEMARVSGKFIWGFEYFAPEFTEINYRGNSNLLWKADYGSLICKVNPEFAVFREELFDCLDEPGLQDKSYLLQKS